MTQQYEKTMNSHYCQKFNHDPIASDYDKNVKNENNPVRAGYKELLNWVQEKTRSANVIVDLGCGTGNTALAIENFKKIYCVDISQNMLNIAKEKLKDKKSVEFLNVDLLSFFDEIENDEEVDVIVSTYAIHHLTQNEKHKLFEMVYNFLPKGGQIIFGDLMFENKNHEKEMRERYPDLVEDFNDEFFWCLEDESKKLTLLGFDIEVKKFSDLSWGIYGEK